MFTVIGERINTTLKKVKAAVTDGDAEYIKDDVRKQTEAGAAYIDVNAGARIGHEVEDMTPSGLWPSDHAGVVAKVKFVTPE